MAILTFPTMVPARSRWGLKSLTEVFTSPLNGASQTAGRLGSRWRATLEYAPLDRIDSAMMDAFMAQLDGMSGRFYLPAHHRLGTGAACTVNGAAQIGKILVLTAMANRTFAVGDYFTVNGEFKMVTAAAKADSTGAVTLQFAPMLRASPAHGTSVIFTQPTAFMMLATDDYDMTHEPGNWTTGFTLNCIEVF